MPIRAVAHVAHVVKSLAAVVAALLLLGAAAQPAEAFVFGTQESDGSAGARFGQVLSLSKAAGAKIFRVQADWARLEPRAQGQVDPQELADLDRRVDAVAAHGMRVVLFIDRTPCWASSAPAELRDGCSSPDANRSDVWRYRPSDPTSAVPISVLLAKRYASKLAAFQIWNEPDQANEAYWAGSDKVATYVALVRALYGPLKAAASKVPVLAGSFVGTDGRWLKAMYASGIKGHYDALAVQFYDLPLLGLRTTRAVQRANGDHKPLWLTEYGYSSCLGPKGPTVTNDQRCVTRAGQARALGDLLAAVRRRPWIAGALQYDVLDDGPGGYSFGLATVGGQPKPVLRAVARAVGKGHPRPTPPTVKVHVGANGAVVSGTASLTDIVTVAVTFNGATYRMTLRTDQRGRWVVRFPAARRTRGLRVSVDAGWTGHVSRRF